MHTQALHIDLLHIHLVIGDLGNVLEDLQIYLDRVQAQVNDMLSKGHTWRMIE